MLEKNVNPLRIARVNKNLSLSDLAAQTQIAEDKLQSLEAGNLEAVYEWPVSKLKEVADLLDLKISQILGETLLDYDEWALIWPALIEYSANRPGLDMQSDMKTLIDKVRKFIPERQESQQDG